MVVSLVPSSNFQYAIGEGEKEKLIKNRDDIVEVMQAILKSEHETDVMKEHFLVIGMNNKN